MKKRFLIKVLSSIMSFIVALSQLPILSNAVKVDENGSIVNPAETVISSDTLVYDAVIETIDFNAYVLSTTIADNVVQPSETIHVAFESNSVSEYTYHTDGLSAVQQVPETMDFQLLPQSEFSSMELIVTHEDGTIDVDTIYVYTHDSVSFVSNLSMDEAFVSGLQYSVEQGKITQAEREAKYVDYIQQYIVFSDLNETTTQNFETNTIATTDTTILALEDDNKVIVRGYLQFRPYEGATTLLPLRYVEVELYDYSGEDSTKVDQTFTDENGYYYMECDAPESGFAANDLSIRFSASSETFYLDGYNEQYYEYRIPSALVAGEEYYGTLYLTYIEDSLLFRYMYIHQIVGIGQRLALSSGATWNEQRLRIVYPSNTFSVSGCFWGYALIVENDWLKPDTLIHEYGHYVQQSQNFGLKLKDILGNCNSKLQ